MIIYLYLYIYISLYLYLYLWLYLYLYIYETELLWYCWAWFLHVHFLESLDYPLPHHFLHCNWVPSEINVEKEFRSSPRNGRSVKLSGYVASVPTSCTWRSAAQFRGDAAAAMQTTNTNDSFLHGCYIFWVYISCTGFILMLGRSAQVQVLKNIVVKLHAKHGNPLRKRLSRSLSSKSDMDSLMNLNLNHVFFTYWIFWNWYPQHSNSGWWQYLY